MFRVNGQIVVWLEDVYKMVSTVLRVIFFASSTGEEISTIDILQHTFKCEIYGIVGYLYIEHLIGAIGDPLLCIISTSCWCETPLALAYLR